MPENAPIAFTFAGLEPGYCFTTPERFALDIAGGLAGYVPGAFNFFVSGSNEPDVSDRNKMWDRLNPDGSPDRIYHFYSGKWVSPNPIAASSQERKWWVGTEAAAWSYDGGDGADPSTTAPTATSGAMWQRDTDYDGKMPIQAGTLPSTAVVNIGDTGGSDVTLLPEHTHTFGRMEGSGTNQDSVAFTTGASTSNAAAQTFNDGSVGGNVNLGSETGSYLVTDGITANLGKTLDADKVKMTNLPPYRAGMWIKRTGRRFYTV